MSAVKPAGVPSRCQGSGFARRPGPGQTGRPPVGTGRVTWILALIAVAALLFLAIRLPGRGIRRRQRAVSRLLDAADSLEDRLRTARSEIEAVAGSGRDPVREAMHEMLRHRLWLQQHGDNAPIEQIESVRDAIMGATRRIEQQLVLIERARAAQ
jgi:hypothetical protein